MAEGNVMIDGTRRDTGMKWVDPATSIAYRIFRKKIAIGALPNATGKNVAHGEADIGLTKYANVVSIYATKAATAVLLQSANIQVELDATNVIVTTATNLSTYTACEIEIEWAA